MNEGARLVLVAVAVAFLAWLAGGQLRDAQLADVGRRNHSGITPADPFGLADRQQADGYRRRECQGSIWSDRLDCDPAPREYGWRR